MPSAQWRTRNPEPGTWNRKLEAGDWQLATGNWQLATGNWQLIAKEI